jgi:broad specificity phosphatase PhoE
VTTLVIVRHAEKEFTGTDPALRPAGRVRATELDRMLGTTHLDGVIASDRRRTLETAAPVARTHAVGIDTVGREGTLDEHVGRLLKLIGGRYAGKSVLVVSHSDVIPALLAALGVSERVEVPDDVYDDLFIVSQAVAGGHPTLLRLHYGSPSL